MDKRISANAFTWSPVPRNEMAFEGSLGFNEIWSRSETSNETRIAYARLELDSPVPNEVEIRFGLHEETHAWLNGEKVLHTRFQGPVHLDDFKSEVSLRTGRNVLIVRSTDREGPWGLLLRIFDMQGRPIQPEP